MTAMFTNETVTIMGRRFPTVALICPPADDQEWESDWDLCLGASSEGYQEWYIPAENGLLFSVRPYDAPAALPGTLSLALCCIACKKSFDPNSDDWIWLPMAVALIDGQLVAITEERRLHMGLWWNAEPDWVVETIDRLSGLPFTIPDGPRARMVPRSSVEKP